MVRRLAEAVQFAGLTGFPHNVMTGTFKDCDTYPKINNEEIKCFLNEAGEKVGEEYYKQILVRTNIVINNLNFAIMVSEFINRISKKRKGAQKIRTRHISIEPTGVKY